MQSKVSFVSGKRRLGAWPSPDPQCSLSWQQGCFLAEAAGEGAKVPAESLSSLDNMLDNLTQDLQELGITATPAGICASCHKPIAGKVSPHSPPWHSSLLRSRHPLQLFSLLLTGTHSPR